MTELNWKRVAAPAAVIQALQAHRLLPVVDLLAERGLLRADLVPLARQLAARSVDEERRRVAIENKVLDAIGGAGVEVLVLKGALLARTVYPAPETRIRTDIDLLVNAERVEDAYSALRGIGFAPSYEVHGGAPMTQAQWIRRGDSPLHAVDLHWDLSNRPLLKDRFQFQSLLDRSTDLPGHVRPVAGLCAGDALLHACTHYFGHHSGEFRPDQWLLDMDLLWRAMGEGEDEQVAEAALSIGVGSLLAEGMRLSADRLETPVEKDWLEALQGASRRERTRRFMQTPRFRLLEIFHSASEEKGVRAAMRNLRGVFFPPAAYMFRKYPGSSKWALPWLYVKRMVGGGKG